MNEREKTRGRVRALPVALTVCAVAFGAAAGWASMNPNAWQKLSERLPFSLPAMVRGEASDAGSAGADGAPSVTPGRVARVPTARVTLPGAGDPAARARELAASASREAARSARELDLSVLAEEAKRDALVDLEVGTLQEQLRAIEELGTIAKAGDPEAFNGLVRALGSSDPRVRAAAVEALAELGTPEAFAEWAEAWNDPHPDNRFGIADNLRTSLSEGDLSADELIPVLEAMLGDPRNDPALELEPPEPLDDDSGYVSPCAPQPVCTAEDVLVAVLKAIGDTGDATLLEEVTALVDHENMDIVSEAGWSAHKTGNPEARVEAAKRVYSAYEAAEGETRVKLIERSLREIGGGPDIDSDIRIPYLDEVIELETARQQDAAIALSLEARNGGDEERMAELGAIVGEAGEVLDAAEFLHKRICPPGTHPSCRPPQTPEE